MNPQLVGEKIVITKYQSEYLATQFGQKWRWARCEH